VGSERGATLIEKREMVLYPAARLLKIPLVQQCYYVWWLNLAHPVIQTGFML